MVGKKSKDKLLREEGMKRPPPATFRGSPSTGLQRQDNGMKQTSWPDIPMINQKNYYTYVSIHIVWRKARPSRAMLLWMAKLILAASI